MTEQVGGDKAALGARVGEAANILVLAPSFESQGTGVCMELLAGETPSETGVLGITYTQSPHEFIEDWHDHAGTAPRRGRVIAVGAPEGAGTQTQATDRWAVSIVENPADLTGVGVELSDALAEREGTPRLCFDSLTALLQYADLKQAFRFCHMVTTRVKAAEAVGHYHLDPAAHDQQTVATVKGLFDAVVTVEETGEWSVTTR